MLAARKQVLNHAALWRFSVRAQCVAEAPVLVEGGAHDHDHDHDHDHAHSDWSVRYRFRCAVPAALTRIETQAFAAFPSLQTIEVQLVDARGARAFALTPAGTRIDLSP